MKLEVVVCDVCKSATREAQSYTVAQGERVVTVDLCSRHAVPLEAVLGGSTRGATAKASTPRVSRGRGVTVTTLAEIEAKKK